MSDKHAVYQSIVAITGELAKEGISKDNVNQQQGFKYRGIDQVYSALSPLLAKHNICILPRIVSKEVVERVNKNGTALFYTTVEAQFDVVSAVDGSSHTVASYGEAMDSGDKSIGKAMSYAYKAMAFMLFAIPTEGDNDPDAQTHEVKPKTTQHTELSKDQQTYFPRIKAALDQLYGDNTEQKKTLIKRLTSFTNKDGKEIQGIDDYRKKDGESLSILCTQIEKHAQDDKDLKADMPEMCAACGKVECECFSG